jgi:hypothetical protein
MRFRPGAAPPWLGVPASEIVNGRLPLEHFWGAEARRLADRLSGTPDRADSAAVMLSALATRRPQESLIDRAAPAILAAIRRDEDAPLRILALADSLDVSERTLRQRCGARSDTGRRLSPGSCASSSFLGCSVVRPSRALRSWRRRAAMLIRPTSRVRSAAWAD